MEQPGVRGETQGAHRVSNPSACLSFGRMLIHNQNRVAPEASETGEAAPPAVKRIFKVTPSLEFSSLAKLLATPVDACIITPKLYFQASNELTVVTLVACWTITLAYDYKLAWDHPARNYVVRSQPRTDRAVTPRSASRSGSRPPPARRAT